MKRYRIDHTQPTVYLNAAGKPVRGFLVTVEFPQFREIHELQVATLAVDNVADAIEALLEEREVLAALGGS